MLELLKSVETAFAGLRADDRVKQQALTNLKQWLEDERLATYRPYIEHLVAKADFNGLLDAFWRMMPFGTGGRRGPVGVGPNRINPHTIALSVQGHCDYLREVVGLKGELKVVVAYDVRRFFDLRGVYAGVDGLLNRLTSMDMARECARTYAANQIVAYVIGPIEAEPGMSICTDRYMSTPELSFLIRELKAAGGVNISASHNHPDDNGGKFYNLHGGQEIPPDDEILLKVVEKIAEVKTMPYSAARRENLIRFVPAELHQRYLELNKALAITDSRSAKVAFTPLCGTGMTTVKETLAALGYRVALVPEQSVYDGSFASVPFRIANPEVPESLGQLRRIAKEQGCDIGFATDPDADRFGMVIPDGKGDFAFLNGNEVGVLLIESILAHRKRSGTLARRPIFTNTTVTSSLQREIARRYGCQVIGDLMVGFKYIGDVLMHLEKSGRFPPEGASPDTDGAQGSLADFVFGCEESHGYLLTPHIRDKDACGAAVHMAGLASELKDRNRNMLTMLRDIYRVYGYYRNQVRSLVMEGIVGLERISRVQDGLRQKPPVEIAGLKVVNFVDYWKVGGPLKSATDRASRNVLLFELKDVDGALIRLLVRPSGTEPKTKIYVEVPSKAPLECTLYDAPKEKLAQISDAQLDETIARTDARAASISNAFMKYCLGPEILGDVYETVPDESLLVSDLVPVDHKIRLCTEILPGLLGEMKKGPRDKADAWLKAQLRPFGEDAKSLVRIAAVQWLDRVEREGGADVETASAAQRLFEA